MALPGQAPSTEDLKANFPSMQVLLSSGVAAELMFPPAQSVGLGLVTVLDQLRVQRVVALGDGAGGSIIARYSTVQYSTVQCSTVQCSAVQYSTLADLMCLVGRASSVWRGCSTVQYSTVQYSAVQYSTVQYSG